MTWKKVTRKVLLEDGGRACPQACSTQKFDVKALARVIKDRI